MLTATKFESTVNPNIISLSTLSREGKREKKKKRNETKRNEAQKEKAGKDQKKKEKPGAKTQINLGSRAGRGIRAVRVEQGPREAP
jgi:hypothetical protein